MPPRIPNTIPSIADRCLSQPCLQTKASFSTTASRPRFTKSRRIFRTWINGQGSVYRKNNPGETNYLRQGSNRNDNRPFPLNPQFISEPVLDDKAREMIWEKVMREGETIKAVSAELGVDIRRVAAVVRLKEVEKDWVAKGKKLAKPYARAVLSMLPTHSFRVGQQNMPFEPINELHVHPYTMKQIFWPTSESRHFTRADAAKAFHTKMLSADERVPHPELIQMEKEVLQGRPLWDASERFKQAAMQSERKAADKELAKAARDEKHTTRVHTKRFEFRFKQINSENVGPKGRARDAVGWRYGAPSYDRSKGEIKIPTSVP
ncbi:eukaryotic mitochondrial regulator protein-domain-containing protein [Hypoxylon rubiginosum]|uniref:Eukaryotic mitochondrial regulator protein-domain-containing protein n=1 Tax=Hypoxylon rubiginosum TaxID=110542 RepID=A0ACC0DA00_9PEZI|nr:eukaryotic mitochondrial regulator protein-domain-containing protein [Hypoxylon rubiginosum]